MSDSEHPQVYNAFVPLLILSIGLAAMLGNQIWWMTSQTALIETARANAETAMHQREETVKQARSVEDAVRVLGVDLLDLAKRDSVAQKIVDHYQIRQSAPNAAPSPAAGR